MHDNHLIVGIHVTDRVKSAGEVQAVLTAYGSSIRTRLGMHDVGTDASSPTGVMILEFIGSEETCNAMIAGLKGISGVDVQQMVFTH